MVIDSDFMNDLRRRGEATIKISNQKLLLIWKVEGGMGIATYLPSGKKIKEEVRSKK